MTYFSLPLPMPAEPTEARAGKDQAIVRTVDAAVVPLGRFDLDTVIGTNASVAPRAPGTAYVLPASSTNDGRVHVSALAPGGPASAILEIRRRTNQTYAEIGRLIGVERRSLYFWLEGRAISGENASRLASVLEVARRSDRGNPSETAAALAKAFVPGPVDSPADRIGQYRVRESDPVASLPYFDVATLIGGEATAREREDDTGA